MNFLLNFSGFAAKKNVKGAASKIPVCNHRQVHRMILPLRRGQLTVKIMSSCICSCTKKKFKFCGKNLERKNIEIFEIRENQIFPPVNNYYREK
jgi:hypothetical protein